MDKKKKNKETLVLLDTHAIIHRAYHAVPTLSSPSGEPINAVYGLAAMLIRIVKELEPEYVVATYDLPGPTHRHEVYKEYKAKRPKIDDELVSQITRSRDVLKAFNIPLYEAPGFEADDCIGTITAIAKKDYDVIIASGDMDTLQLVDDERVRVFTLRRGITDTVLYDENGVVERYGFPPKAIPDYKGFAGDPSDNIIGIQGIGEKTATILLKVFGSVEGVYRALKKDKKKLENLGLTERVIGLLSEHEDEAEFSKVLATIRTDAPINFKKPAKTFKENLDIEKLTHTFTELGFRSLIPRLKGLTGEGKSVMAESPKKQTEEGAALSHSGSLFQDDSPLAKETKVMFWLTNSDITNPTAEDVLNNTHSKTIEEAHEKLMVTLKKEDLTDVFENIEKPLIPVIEAINKKGVLIDSTYLKDLSKEYHKELDGFAKKIFKVAGEEFNLNSPKQLGDVLFTKLGIGSTLKRQKKTATGQFSTRESELEKLKGGNPIIEDILAYRELQKLLSTYIDAIPPLLDGEGRLHTTYIQTGATTGRLASQNPGLQNIPVKTELGRRIRKGFIARNGFSLVSFDYSQIELRLAAILSGDGKLQAIFKRGEDVHAAVAAEVFNVSEKEVNYDMRRRAKVINFGILYGMGVNALRENLGTDRAEAQEFYNRYFETFSGLAAYLSKTKAEASRVGYTKTLFGRKRYFPGIRSKIPFVRAMAERMAINAPLQGTQADMIKLAMVKIHNYLSKHFENKAAIVLQIHDELIFEVEKGVILEASKEIQHVMEHILTKEETDGVPILVSGAVGPNWGEMEKL